jgi:hypothetical protein
VRSPVGHYFLSRVHHVDSRLFGSQSARVVVVQAEMLGIAAECDARRLTKLPADPIVPSSRPRLTPYCARTVRITAFRRIAVMLSCRLLSIPVCAVGFFWLNRPERHHCVSCKRIGLFQRLARRQTATRG